MVVEVPRIAVLRRGEGVFPGGLGQGQGEVIAGGLLGGDDERVQVGSEPAIHQR